MRRNSRTLLILLFAANLLGCGAFENKRKSKEPILQTLLEFKDYENLPACVSSLNGQKARLTDWNSIWTCDIQKARWQPDDNLAFRQQFMTAFVWKSDCLPINDEISLYYDFIFTEARTIIFKELLRKRDDCSQLPPEGALLRANLSLAQGIRLNAQLVSLESVLVYSDEKAGMPAKATELSVSFDPLIAEGKGLTLDLTTWSPFLNLTVGGEVKFNPVLPTLYTGLNFPVGL